nr:translation initiation factor IF-2-like [Equus asinus]
MQVRRSAGCLAHKSERAGSQPASGHPFQIFQSRPGIFRPEGSDWTSSTNQRRERARLGAQLRPWTGPAPRPASPLPWGRVGGEGESPGCSLGIQHGGGSGRGGRGAGELRAARGRRVPGRAARPRATAAPSRAQMNQPGLCLPWGLDQIHSFRSVGLTVVPQGRDAVDE